MKIDGSVALVTGANRGLGRLYAQAGLTLRETVLVIFGSPRRNSRGPMTGSFWAGCAPPDAGGA
jgi:NAD(P)-dependent dehydrogenase (short-subunit alcohol dehydrogenase family)